MSPDEPLLWVLAKSIGGGAFLLHSMLTPVRMRAIPGTRHRYFFATLQRAVETPALAAPVAFMAEAIRHDSVGDVLVAGTILLVWLFHRWLRARDDDDDWFKDAGKRARRRLGERSLRPAGQAAGG